jgi:hypothetical protein
VQHSLACLASLLVVAALAACAALRSQFNARGHGAPDGSWIIAGALALGPCTFSLVSGQGAPLRLDFHFWGRRWPLAHRASPPATSAEKPEKVELPGGPAAWWPLRTFGLSPLELVELALNEGRYLEWERLVVDLAYGFQDVALTGRVAGALYALAGALPDRFVIRQRPIWEAGERWEASVEGSLRIWPGLVLFSVLWYIIRRKAARFGRTRRPPTELATRAHHPS